MHNIQLITPTYALLKGQDTYTTFQIFGVDTFLIFSFKENEYFNLKRINLIDQN